MRRFLIPTGRRRLSSKTSTPQQSASSNAGNAGTSSATSTKKRRRGGRTTREDQNTKRPRAKKSSTSPAAPVPSPAAPVDSILAGSKLYKVIEKEMQCMPKGDLEKARSKAKKLGKFPVCGLCSGSNVAFLALLCIFDVLGASYIRPTNLFDVEIDKEKQRWLADVMNQTCEQTHATGPCLFPDIADMNGNSSRCVAHNGRCEVPSGIDGPILSSCGFSCKSWSPQNSKRSAYKNSIAQNVGPSAKALHGWHGYCFRHQRHT